MPNAPQLRANAEKSGLWRVVCQTSHSPARCYLLILPSWPLLSSTWVMFMPYRTAVVTSAMYCANPPSPVPATGRVLGRVLREAAVACGRDRGAFGCGGPGADSGRVAEADRAQVAG